MRLLTTFVLVVAGWLPSSAATLEKLSLEQMIEKSTAIVRGRIAGSSTMKRGPVIYTLSRVQVQESWKGAETPTVEVAVPGGAYGDLRQHFSGAPSFPIGQEFVLFLWSGRSGLTQVIGLSQGVFGVRVNEKGEAVAERAATQEVILDPAHGYPIKDEAISLPLSELRRRVQSVTTRLTH